MLDVSEIKKEFPILQTKIRGEPLCYLDNGASAQKPKCVIDAVTRGYELEYANVHRGLHYLSNLATEKFESVREKIQNYFFSGILIVAPLGLSVYVAWIVVGLADRIFRPFVPLEQLGIPSEIPGVGLIVAFVFFTILGAIAGSFFGRFYHKVVDGILSKIPGLNSIYSTVKQIIDTFATTQSNAFKEVVLIEYPQKDIYALAFLTSETKGEISARKKIKMINVFMPSTPNPTTGFLMFVPLSKCIRLSMSVDQAIKYIISAGLVTPTAPAIKKTIIKKKTSTKKLAKK